MKLGIFVIGTGTKIGKTTVSSFLASSLRSFSIRTGYFKPIQMGVESDTSTVSNLTGIPMSKLPHPTYSFPEVMVPSRAAAQRGIEIQLEKVAQDWIEFDHRAWIVESTGGLLVPLNGRKTNRDLNRMLELKTVVVSSTSLEAINQTLLTVECAQNSGLVVAGIILVGEEGAGFDSLFNELSGVPVIARIPYFPDLSPCLVQDLGVSLFPASTLSLLFE